MACNLRRRSSFHVVSWDSSPITFPYFLQSNQKQLVLFLRPWNPWSIQTFTHTNQHLI
jgi:hypothetical protein